MGRYPSRNGLAIPVTELGYSVVEPQRRVTNNHHLYFERNRYRQPIHQLFRGLVTNVYTMYIHDHTELHEKYDRPFVPELSKMYDVLEEYIALNGVLDVVKEQKTNQTYQVTTDQWELVRGASNANMRTTVLL